MIILLKNDYKKEDLLTLLNYLKKIGADYDICNGKNSSIINVLNNADRVDVSFVKDLNIAVSINTSYDSLSLVKRKDGQRDTVVNVNSVKFGGKNFSLIAGPCAVESEKQIIEIAMQIKKAGANMLRGGAFKPRTSPYSFQGLGKEGIDILVKAKKETGIPIVTEIMGINQLDYFMDVDVIQIGARDMQNYELLKEVGKSKKPILLKRGFSNTVYEWLMSAEYLLSEGAKDVVLCERGIRTFETTSRTTLDLSSLPIVKSMTHLPIIVDPSHAVGKASSVKPLALAGATCGADGLMIEVHNNPPFALSDGAQAILPTELKNIVKNLNSILPIVNKNIIKA